MEDDPRLEDFREVSYYIAAAKFAKLNKRSGSNRYYYTIATSSRRGWLVPAAGRGRRQQAGKITPITPVERGTANIILCFDNDMLVKK